MSKLTILLVFEKYEEKKRKEKNTPTMNFPILRSVAKGKLTSFFFSLIPEHPIMLQGSVILLTKFDGSGV